MDARLQKLVDVANGVRGSNGSVGINAADLCFLVDSLASKPQSDAGSAGVPDTITPAWIGKARKADLLAAAAVLEVEADPAATVADLRKQLTAAVE